MGKLHHRPCPWRRRIKHDGETLDYCTVQPGDHPPDAPICGYCADRRQPARKTTINRKAKR